MNLKWLLIFSRNIELLVIFLNLNKSFLSNSPSIPLIYNSTGCTGISTCFPSIPMYRMHLRMICGILHCLQRTRTLFWFSSVKAQRAISPIMIWKKSRKYYSRPASTIWTRCENFHKVSVIYFLFFYTFFGWPHPFDFLSYVLYMIIFFRYLCWLKRTTQFVNLWKKS